MPNKPMLPTAPTSLNSYASAPLRRDIGQPPSATPMRSAASRWNIPESLAKAVVERDTHCVYCHKSMTDYAPRGEPRYDVASWEHIDNDLTNITAHNIGLCCCSCNSSKGKRSLTEWFATSYCKQRGINPDTVAAVVRGHLR